MSELAELAKILMLVSGLKLGAFHTGDGAFYNAVDMRELCIYRNEMRWTNGYNLDCTHHCLAAWGLYQPEMLGKYVLAKLPGCYGYQV